MGQSFSDLIKPLDGMHVEPRALEVIRFFNYDHLPDKLRSVSESCARLAVASCENLNGDELTAGLRKLLEAKDCFVRAAL